MRDTSTRKGRRSGISPNPPMTSDAAREWVGGRLVMPVFVMEGEARRPEIILWLELPDELIVGCQLVDPKGPPVAFAQTLRGAMKKPMAGAPRRPERVRVAEEGLAQELHAVFGDKLDVRVAPTPELESLLGRIFPPMAGRDEPESYLEPDELTPAAVEDLFQSAEMLYGLAPWKVADDDQVLRVDIPSLGVQGWCLSIIGALGESLGFVLFPSLEGYDAFVRAADKAQRQSPPDFGTSSLALTFERGADLPSAMRREVAEHRWPVAGPEAYPRLEHREADGALRPLTTRDVRIGAACARAIVTLLIRHPGVFKDDKGGPICESYQDERDLLVRITAPYEAFSMFQIDKPKAIEVGRNRPCPCGSGKKYKKCCLAVRDKAGRSGVERATVHDLDERLVNEMARYATRRFGRAWRRCAEAFVDPEEAGQLFLPWSVYEATVKGRPIVEWFLEERGRRLRDEEREWLGAQRRAWLSVWEVTEVEPGRSVTVRDLLTGEERCIQEVSGSQTLVRRDAVLGRVVDQGGLSVFCGTHPRPLPPVEAAEVVRRTRARIRRKGVVPIERLRDQAIGRYLITRWEKAVDELDLLRAMPPKLHNTDGEELLLTTDHFTFEPARRAEIESRLAAIKDVSLPLENEPEPHFTFLRPGNAMHKRWENTVMGTASLSEESLRLETNSVKRADDLRRRVEAACGALLHHRVREHSDPLALLDRRKPVGPRTSTMPSQEAAQMIKAFKEKSYADWIDESIPALGGKTPREAARTSLDREKLDILLKDIENREARLPEVERFDFSRIRRELGLDRT
jgi:hypothetical protein